MKTPVETPKEIIAEALADAHDIDMTDDLYAAAILRKLEERYVIVDPENVTEGMVEAAIGTQKLRSDYCYGDRPDDDHWLKRSVIFALRAAPRWTKGSEG